MLKNCEEPGDMIEATIQDLAISSQLTISSIYVPDK